MGAETWVVTMAASPADAGGRAGSMGADGAQASRVVVIAEVGNHALPHSNADGLALLGVRACRQTDGRTDGR
jgi:hypothetical protein